MNRKVELVAYLVVFLSLIHVYVQHKVWEIGGWFLIEPLGIGLALTVLLIGVTILLFFIESELLFVPIMLLGIIWLGQILFVIMGIMLFLVLIMVVGVTRNIITN